MKPTININIGGSVFTLDNDAYDLLKEYIDTLHHVFDSQEDGAEVADDMEMRISEILLENHPGGAGVVTRSEIQLIINRMGRPEEIEDIEISEEHPNAHESERVIIDDTTTTVPPPIPPQEPKVRKRLFRDPDNKLIGGVCSGMGAYLGIDTTWVRLIFVACTFISFGYTSLVYLILWIVLPAANTPVEKMQMYGESPTMENISRTVGDAIKPKRADKQNQSVFQNIIDVLMIIVAWCAKVLLVLCLIVLVPVLVGLILAILVIICVFIGGAVAYPDWFSGSQEFFNFTGNPVWALLCSIGGICLLAIPAFAVVYTILRRWCKWKELSTRLKSGLVIAWFVALGIFVWSTAMIVRHSETNNPRFRNLIEMINDAPDIEISEQEGTWEDDSIPMQEALDLANKNGIVTISVSDDYGNTTTIDINRKKADAKTDSTKVDVKQPKIDTDTIKNTKP